MSVSLKRIHHVAYHCHDAKETVEFYQHVLNMDFQLAIAENEVPSTKEPASYMHVFLDAGMGNVLTFFELPSKTHIEGKGLDVLGPLNHGIFKSIYFFDPNSHHIELAAHTGTAEQMKMLHDVAPLMLKEWSQTKRAPNHAAWLHEK